jgi:hypothetical protein
VPDHQDPARGAVLRGANSAFYRGIQKVLMVG